MDMEMKEIQTNGSDGATYLSNEHATAGNGNSVAHRMPDVSETDVLLPMPESGYNGETTSGHAAGNQRNLGNAYMSRESNWVYRIKRELNEVICWRVKVWMLIIFIFLLIVVIIIISLAVCSAAIHEDEDEKFDASLFIIPRDFNGSFQLPNLVFSDDLFTISSNESQALAAHFEEKLTDLYKSSPALGRYFSQAEIHAFRNGSVSADYQLKFLLPEDQQDALKNFTLSREMVYNVFRQFLYDQQPDESALMYIDPVSLKMF